MDNLNECLIQAKLDRDKINENIVELEKQIKQSEVTYKIGDKFDNTWDDPTAVLMLCRMSPGKCGLMCVGGYSPGTWWLGTGFVPKDCGKITKEELDNYFEFSGKWVLREKI